MNCKVADCSEEHAKHFCRVCQDNDSKHFARNCPKGKIVYHGTKRQFADIIKSEGFKASAKGRMGPGVYFTLDFEQAKKIANYRYSLKNPVVIACRAIVQYKKFRYDDSEEEMIDKLKEWIQFSQNTVKSGFHPPWANNQEFKEVCVRNPKTIRIIQIHDV